MKSNAAYKIHFEPRIEIRPDHAIVETFQDGSQLIRKHGHLIIVEASATSLSSYEMPANISLFSKN